MDEGLKNRVIKILEDEQNQLDGVYDPQSDVSAPSKVTNVTVTPNDDGTWNIEVYDVTYPKVQTFKKLPKKKSDIPPWYILK